MDGKIFNQRCRCMCVPCRLCHRRRRSACPVGTSSRRAEHCSSPEYPESNRIVNCVNEKGDIVFFSLIVYELVLKNFMICEPNVFLLS